MIKISEFKSFSIALLFPIKQSKNWSLTLGACWLRGKSKKINVAY